MEQIIIILAIIVAYTIGIFLTYLDVKDNISYLTSHTASEIIINGNINYFFAENGKKLIFICSLLFPLYLAYKLGFFFGHRVYEILIDKNNENRIASWVI